MQVNVQKIAYFFCIVLLVAILFSKFLMTVAMLGLVAVGLYHWKREPQVWRQFWGNKAFVVLTGIFLIVLLTGIYSEDQGYFLERLRIKLPFLVLPFFFAILPRFSNKEYYGIFYLLLLLMSVISFGVLVNYAVNYEQFNLDIKESRSIPTPIHHIRYSLLTALAILGGFILWRKKFFLFKEKIERFAILGMTLFLLVFIHILSVRSGLLALYGVVFVLSLHYIFSSKRYFIGGAVLVGLFLLPVAAYLLLPSFQTKINLSIHNYYLFQQGRLENYSDTQRMASYVAGLEAARENPLLGVGFGDVRNEVKAAYAKLYPGLTYKDPHNQFLFFYVGAGLLGLLGFTFCFFFPLFYRRNFREPLFLGLYVIVFCSFMVEATIETAVGTAFFVFFVLLCVSSTSVEELTSTYPIQN